MNWPLALMFSPVLVGLVIAAIGISFDDAFFEMRLWLAAHRRRRGRRA